MNVLVKLGGTLLDNPESRARLTQEIVGLDARTVVVHGGGKQMTRFLAERGVESKFINGLRVTTPEVLDAVLKVFAGTVNHELVSAFQKAGAKAVGLTGIDAGLAIAESMGGDLGAVGRPVRSNPEVLNVLVDNGFLPVVACIGGGEQGEIYNVNADQMAVSCATGFKADRLLFLTDVPGVRTDQEEVASVLDIDDIDRLITGGIATGGMQAKLDAAKSALAAGVGEVIIALGQTPGIVAQATGTRIVRRRP